MEGRLGEPETFALAVNLTVIALGYFVVYPRFAGADVRRLVVKDLIASVVALGVVGYAFAGSGQTFTLVAAEVGWLPFTLITFFVLETPFFLWYCRRHGIGMDRLSGDE
jgi:hypothetical protein